MLNNLYYDIKDSELIDNSADAIVELAKVAKNSLEVINNELSKVKSNQSIELAIIESDDYKAKKKKLILSELEDDITRAAERIAKRKTKLEPAAKKTTRTRKTTEQPAT